MMPLQILWWDPCTKAVSSLQQDVHRMQKDGPFQEGVPEQKRESHEQAGSQESVGNQ